MSPEEYNMIELSGCLGAARHAKNSVISIHALESLKNGRIINIYGYRV
ncbi:hypothetical protein B0F87_106317 [Methylobacter tundripaludum]|uniref:Uncharacterized protein n=1 Tax=Methylobacter tundripaludum TaxID=173365 RepID=A0A2S6HDC4_9GAMM|nr:hypothetical protein [Methylobacter tundripaludum]PPK75468.1 hypothetical protein B0F87_106317 [Methylobacter tundripaludum]